MSAGILLLACWKLLWLLLLSVVSADALPDFWSSYEPQNYATVNYFFMRFNGSKPQIIEAKTQEVTAPPEPFTDLTNPSLPMVLLPGDSQLQIVPGWFGGSHDYGFGHELQDSNAVCYLVSQADLDVNPGEKWFQTRGPPGVSYYEKLKGAIFCTKTKDGEDGDPKNMIPMSRCGWQVVGQSNEAYKGWFTLTCFNDLDKWCLHPDQPWMITLSSTHTKPEDYCTGQVCDYIRQQQLAASGWFSQCRPLDDLFNNGPELLCRELAFLKDPMRYPIREQHPCLTCQMCQKHDWANVPLIFEPGFSCDGLSNAGKQRSKPAELPHIPCKDDIMVKNCPNHPKNYKLPGYCYY
ncbi:hypothetical protein BCR37DRAFT_251687 [Protomyces lactucae-debilis]|uniref:Uncharacterized protein n=1 Tax=Protomyces lactucae-debilis TaxID=2754530 RepID=A0A1Y2FQ09_PROLT|nr:uncharacterized protein BCR37DRAFT_251687 [Protomyces lactucae-debilis]ORY84795.1 hypothetical protein BCR37DRAFT_251687 [Protomyces lactucae-debilis]